MAAQAIADANGLHELAVREPLPDIARLGEAIAAAERARAALCAGGDKTQRRAVEAISSTLERERQEAERDRDTLARLAEIRSSKGEDITEHLQADAEYAQAFAEYGIPMEALSDAEAAARILRTAACRSRWSLSRRSTTGSRCALQR